MAGPRLPEDFRAVDAVVAIPVRDEVERIADCLIALAQQDGRRAGVVLLVNNTTDDTLRRVAEVAPSLDCPVVAIEHQFPPAAANAGQARRLAMRHADQMAPDGVPLLTTDADGRVAPDWLAANLHHLERGLDAVFGRAEIDPVEAARIPPALEEADAAECAYTAVLDEIESLLDPDPDDPWPRHAEHSGASIAVQRQVYRRVGGIPAAPLGEDRAFHAALRRADARIRHAPEVRVTVSGRILGRAVGGMADTIRQRLVAAPVVLDDALEPVAARMRRLGLRRAARRAYGSAQGWAVFVARFPAVAAARQFGQAWAVLDAARPRVLVPVSSLPAEMARAVSWRDGLRRRAQAETRPVLLESS